MLNATALLWSIAASAVVVLAAGYKLISWWKARWITEAERTKAIAENTTAVKELGQQFDGYARRTDATLNGHGQRLKALEDFTIKRRDQK
jgi:uncharacterized membrane protein YjdF